jgi:ABC-type polysaccharide transport system permease subunit
MVSESSAFVGRSSCKSLSLSLSLSLCVSLAILLSDLNCCCVRACSLGAMQDEILVVVVVVRIVDERIHGNGGFVGQVI